MVLELWQLDLSALTATQSLTQRDQVKYHYGMGWENHNMGVCQNYGPRLGPINERCRIILRTQKGTIFLDNHADGKFFLERVPAWYYIWILSARRLQGPAERCDE